MPENNCNTLRSCIPKIDLSKTVNRDKYQKHLKRISRSNSMGDTDIYSCTDTSTAQRLVNTLSDQVIQRISEACECASRETKSTTQPPFKRKPWWSKSTKIAKMENPCGTLFGLLVGSRVGVMYIFVINLPSQNTDKLIVVQLVKSRNLFKTLNKFYRIQDSNHNFKNK